MAGNSVSLSQLLLKLGPKVGERHFDRRPQTPQVLHSRMQIESLLTVRNQSLDHCHNDLAWIRHLLVH
jgi:hypothetical protein